MIINRFPAIGGFAAHFDVAASLQDDAHPFTHRFMIVGDKNAQGCPLFQMRGPVLLLLNVLGLWAGLVPYLPYQLQD